MSVDFVERRLPDPRLSVVLLLAHLALPPGLWVAYRIGRPRFFGLALYITLAVLLIDVLLLLEGESPLSAIRTVEHPTVALSGVDLTVLDWRFAAALLLFNVAILAVVGPGVPFYVGITTVIGVLLYRIYTLDRRTASIGSEISLIVGSSLTLFASQLKVPYLIRTADTVNHTSTAMVLAREANLAAISSTRYFFFSVFHILSAIGMQFSALEPRLFMSIEVALLFQVALIGAYLFFRYFSGYQGVALISTILLSINIAFIHYGTSAHYQSLSFVLFCAFLFLLFREVWAPRDVLITVLVIAAWIGSHHVSILMAILLSAPPVLFLGFRTWRSDEQPHWFSTAFVFLVFCLMFVTYWTVITVKFQEVLVWVFASSAAASGLPSGRYIVQMYESLEVLISQSIPFLVDSLHYAFLLGFAGLGLIKIATSDRIEGFRWQVILIGFVPAAVLYFPNPLWVPLEGLAEFNRWRLMVLPFLMIVPAVGIARISRPRSGAALRKAGVTLVVFALIFVTMTSGLTNPSLTDIVGIQKEPREYLSNDELAATGFAVHYANDRQPVYARWNMNVYIRKYAWAGEFDFDGDQLRLITASDAERKILSKSGLTILSQEAFREQGINARIVDIESKRNGNANEMEVHRVVFSSTYRWNGMETSVIYSSGGTAIYYEPTTTTGNRTESTSTQLLSPPPLRPPSHEGPIHS